MSPNVRVNNFSIARDPSEIRIRGFFSLESLFPRSSRNVVGRILRRNANGSGITGERDVASCRERRLDNAFEILPPSPPAPLPATERRRMLSLVRRRSSFPVYLPPRRLRASKRIRMIYPRRASHPNLHFRPFLFRPISQLCIPLRSGGSLPVTTSRARARCGAVIYRRICIRIRIAPVSLCARTPNPEPPRTLRARHRVRGDVRRHPSTTRARERRVTRLAFYRL